MGKDPISDIFHLRLDIPSSFNESIKELDLFNHLLKTKSKSILRISNIPAVRDRTETYFHINKMIIFPTSSSYKAFQMINCSKALHLVPLVLLTGCLGAQALDLCSVGSLDFLFLRKSSFFALGEPDYFPGVW